MCVSESTRELLSAYRHAYHNRIPQFQVNRSFGFPFSFRRAVVKNSTSSAPIIPRLIRRRTKESEAHCVISGNPGQLLDFSKVALSNEQGDLILGRYHFACSVTYRVNPHPSLNGCELYKDGVLFCFVLVPKKKKKKKAKRK